MHATPPTTALHRSAPAPARPEIRPFPLLRHFALLSAVAFAIAVLGGARAISSLVERTSLERDAEVMTEFVNSIVAVEGVAEDFAASRLPRDRDAGEPEEFLSHLAAIPGVLRVNAYGRDRSLVWSTDSALIGRRFTDNPELEEAFGGRHVISSGRVGDDGSKSEHVGFSRPGERWVENYLPIWRDPERREVVGVIEIYRTPAELFGAIEAAAARMALGASAVALVLYLGLFGLVWRAAAVIRHQQAALVEAERLAVAGEMASAVAHGLRNPLASIRSSAELALDWREGPEVQELLRDIVAQSDRLEGWIRQYLVAARGDPEGSSELGPSIDRCLADLAPQLERHGILAERRLEPNLPAVRMNPVLLQQVLNGLLTNAVEALSGPGRIRIDARRAAGRVVLEIGDDGPGMEAEATARALDPFVTGKPGGLGLGLPLAKAALERQGGTLVLASRPGGGTTVTLTFRAVEPEA
jgi:signal transduction histidine kinase